MGVLDFSLQTIFGGAGLLATAGAAVMMSSLSEQRRAAAVLFSVAGVAFWLYGITWAVNAEAPMWIRLLTSGVIGGASAMLFTYLISISLAQQPSAGGASSSLPGTTEQHNVSGPNVIVPGSGNTLTINPITPPSQPSRDPDGVYQFNRLVGYVEAARPDIANGYVNFDAIRGDGEFNPSETFEYRNYVLKMDMEPGVEQFLKSIGPNPRGHTSQGFVGARAKIINILPN
jgi:hypothetical protein